MEPDETQDQNQSQAQPLHDHPEVRRALASAPVGSAGPVHNSVASAISPEGWQQMLALFGPVLVALIKAVLEKLQAQINPTQPAA